MLADIPNQTWTWLVIGLVIAGALFGWLADLMLGRRGIGSIFSMVLTTAAAYGGLKAMDWAILHNYVPYNSRGAVAFAMAAIVTATLALILACGLKRLLWR
ncbi:MAG: hypothetical protein P4L82_11240 [Ancalomicrobiaceae bacterium]|nr:hypothetical protein [Ancalomicrobiaceae bacterium]